MPFDMTQSLWSGAVPLLAPPLLRDPAQLATTPDLVPAVSGIYGWWIDAALADVPREGTLRLDGRDLLYVGIAPNGASAESRRTLRSRLSDHCRGQIARSTLRRTLTALLHDQLRFSVWRTPAGKLAMSQADEGKLSAWMSAHMRVAWMEHPTPWVLEDELIHQGPALPLNVAGSSHRFTPTLKRLREALGRELAP